MKKLLIFTFLLSLMRLNAQVDVGLFAGSVFYNGDIDVTPKNAIPQMRPALGVFGRLAFTPSFAVRGQATYATVYGNEKVYPSSDYRAKRGFSFKTPTIEISAQMEWHFLKLDKGFYLDDQDPFFSVYAFGGAGVAFFNPKTDFNEPNYVIDDVSADKNAHFSKTTLVLPGGVGLKMKLTPSIVFGLEGSFRKTSTDYLDGISKLIASRSKDYYFFTGMTISYNFDGSNGYSGGNWGKGSKTHYQY